MNCALKRLQVHINAGPAILGARLAVLPSNQQCGHCEGMNILALQRVA